MSGIPGTPKKGRRFGGTAAHQKAMFGNLVASITVQQIGTTGTATPEQIIARWREVTSGQSAD